MTFLYVFILNPGLIDKPHLKYASLLFGALRQYFMHLVYMSRNLASKRQASIMQAFPDALDMMLICVEAGMSIEMAFSKVGGEIGSASAELAEELTLTVAELSYLQERRQAYENLAERTGHEGVKAVCLALIQGERYGTPLGDALRVMAKENRDMRMSAAEEKSRGASGKAHSADDPVLPAGAIPGGAWASLYQDQSARHIWLSFRIFCLKPFPNRPKPAGRAACRVFHISPCAMPRHRSASIAVC